MHMNAPSCGPIDRNFKSPFFWAEI